MERQLGIETATRDELLEVKSPNTPFCDFCPFRSLVLHFSRRFPIRSTYHRIT